MKLTGVTLKQPSLGISLKSTNKCDFVLLAKLRALCTSNLKWHPFDVVNVSGDECEQQTARTPNAFLYVCMWRF